MPPKTGEPRLARVPLQPFRPRDWLRGWNWALSLGLPALVLAAFLPCLFRDDGAQTLVTPRGPVASVHATWEANCTACHEPLTPSSNGSWTAPLYGHGKVSNARCQACHEGPPHHETQSFQPNCTSCHREHRGRQASLVRIPDSDCTGCHDNLAAHYNGPKEKLAFRNVSTFTAKGHPQFRLFTDQPRDPGKLRFNHFRHLTPGMTKEADGQRPFTLGDLAPADRDRYARQQSDRRPSAPVELNCASCHVTDAADLGLERDRLVGLPAAALLPARRAGDTMLPITFENQCRACHPLTFEVHGGKFRGDGPTLPHRLQPNEVRNYLEGFYTQQVFRNQPDLFKEFLPTRPLPGKLLNDPMAVKFRELIDRKVTAAGKSLFQGEQTCGLCHYPEGKQVGPDVFPQGLVPTKVPDIWLKNAVFSHQAHRAVDCRHCHDRAPGSREAGDVLLPGVQKCLQCHGPPRVAEDGGKIGGARSDCVECHSYHHGDAPLHGAPAPTGVECGLNCACRRKTSSQGGRGTE